MRNDTLDELDEVPSLSTDAADRSEFGHFPRRIVEPDGRPVPVVKRGGNTAPLWALVGAMAIALGGVAWWSHQQLLLMEQQLIATQESFAKISEEAAGRLDDIRGKVVATESTTTTDREQLRLQVKQLQGKLADQARQQQASLSQFDGQQGKRLDQLSTELKAQQESAAQLINQLDGKLKALADEQGKLKSLQNDIAASNERIKSMTADIASLNTDVGALKKQGNQSQAIKSLQDDLLVLRSEVDNRPAPSSNTAEFDAFRKQMTRNINTLQAQIQNLQSQMDSR
ncbi:ATPase [Pseudomonas schmalbachii]|uniref:ATPase n=1 Tax=Pseudomonas schmalbachii TaxID=2816993 RepID=A0ABS3TMW1_9PSED|nr:ATPase [Pseudomonas schmalbachii]MBO3275000.1 ATPase [Pseudomonas schmalbachii]